MKMEILVIIGVAFLTIVGIGFGVITTENARLRLEMKNEFRRGVETLLDEPHNFFWKGEELIYALEEGEG